MSIPVLSLPLRQNRPAVRFRHAMRVIRTQSLRQIRFAARFGHGVTA